MGRVYLELLDGAKIYTCKSCGSHLTNFSQLVSKAFRGRGGKAYLFHGGVNLIEGVLEQRSLLTGLHLVCDLYCRGCLQTVGWKYEKAFEEQQKYKEGKIILEKIALKKESWE